MNKENCALKLVNEIIQSLRGSPFFFLKKKRLQVLVAHFPNPVQHYTAYYLARTRRYVFTRSNFYALSVSLYLILPHYHYQLP